MEFPKWSWQVLTVLCLTMDISQGLKCGVCHGAYPECLRHYPGGQANNPGGPKPVRQEMPTGDCPEWCYTCAPNVDLEGDFFERGCMAKSNEYGYGLMPQDANKNAHPGGGKLLPEACHLTICDTDLCNGMGWDNITATKTGPKSGNGGKPSTTGGPGGNQNPGDGDSASTGLQIPLKIISMLIILLIFNIE